MSWSNKNMAAGAAWAILAHHQVAQINPELTPFPGAGTYPLAALRYYNPHASTLHQEVKAEALADKFTAYLFHFYRPWFENLPASESGTARLKLTENMLFELFKNPEGKTLDDLAKLLDEQLVFADEVEGTV